MHSQHGSHQCRSSVPGEEHHHSNPQIRRLCSCCDCTVEGQIWLLVSLEGVGLKTNDRAYMGRFQRPYAYALSSTVLIYHWPRICMSWAQGPLVSSVDGYSSPGRLLAPALLRTCHLASSRIEMMKELAKRDLVHIYCNCADNKDGPL